MRYSRLSSYLNGRVLDVKGGSTEAGTQIIVWDYQGTLNQMWYFVPVPNSGGYVKIVSAHSGLVLDVKGGHGEDGAAVIVWHDTGGLNQQWKLVTVAGLLSQIVSRLNGKVLDVKGAEKVNGAEVILWTPHSPPQKFAHQLWIEGFINDLGSSPIELELSRDYERQVVFEGGNIGWENTVLVVPPKPASTSPSTTWFSGVLFGLGADAANIWRADYAALVEPRHSRPNHVVAVKAEAINLLSLLPPAVKLAPPVNLQWRVEPYEKDSTLVRIRSLLHDKVLDVKGGSDAAGTAVILWDSLDGLNQLWRMVPTSHGYTKFVSAQTGMVLDVQGGTGEDGAAVIVWPDTGGLNQQWKVTVAGANGASTIQTRLNSKALNIPGADKAIGVGATIWPLYLGFGSSDNILVRTKSAALWIHQVVVFGSKAAPIHMQTGAELAFRSLDGGKTWTYGSIADPFDPAYAGGAYGRTTSQGGLDRVEAHVSRSGASIFMNCHGDGETAANSVLFCNGQPYSPLNASSTGTSWKLADTFSREFAWYMMSSTDRLFLLAPTDPEQPHDLTLRWYSLPDITLKHEEVIAHDVCSFFAIPDRFDQCTSIALIGKLGMFTLVRVAYPQKETIKLSSGETYVRQILRSGVWAVSDTAAFPVGPTTTIVPSSNKGSILGVVCVETDRFDFSMGDSKNVIFYYWFETEFTDQLAKPGKTWGKTTVKGKLVQGMNTWSSTLALAQHADGTTRSWDGYHITGDYNKGAFFYDSSHPFPLRFLAQWVETPSNSDWELHTNCVSVK